MRISPIQQMTIWVDGKLEQINFLSVYCPNDNLFDRAVFEWKLYQTESIALLSGYLCMEGEDYEDWGNQPDINQAALIWVAQQLNITLI